MSGVRLAKATIGNKVAVPVEAPERILIVPWGDVKSTSGSFVIDDAAAASIIEVFAATGVDLPVDLEHQTVGGEYSSPDGAAPAVGWITSLEPVPGEGIYAHVEWTERGAGFIHNKEYRYLSPTLLHPVGSKDVRGLHSVGLTNKPAIVGMKAIVNATPKGTSMNERLERAKWFLNLEELATEEEILMKMEEFVAQLRELADATENADNAGVLSALKAKLGKAKADEECRLSVCKAVGLDETTAHAGIVAAVGALKAEPAKKTEPDPTEYVPMAAHTEVADQLKALHAELRTIQSETFLAKGRDKGQISPHSEKQWREKFIADPAQAEKDLTLVPEGTFPKPGRVTAHSSAQPAGGGDGRGSIIAEAKAEYGENQTTLPCSEKEYVDQALSEHSETLLTDQEVSTHSVKV